MDKEYSTHRYHTRSKGPIKEQPVHTPPLKTVNLSKKKLVSFSKNKNKQKVKKTFKLNESSNDLISMLIMKNIFKHLKEIDYENQSESEEEDVISIGSESDDESCSDDEINYKKDKKKKIKGKIYTTCDDNDNDDEDDTTDSDFDLSTENYYIENSPPEIDYISEEEDYICNLEIYEQETLYRKERKIIEFSKSKIPLRFKILNSSISLATKSAIIDKLNYLSSLEKSDNEYHKMYNWIKNFEKIPIEQYCLNKAPSISDSHSSKIDYLANLKHSLDKCVFGHSEAKMKIIQFMTQQITNPKSIGNCIAIQGPAGNGKTTLVKEGICKSIGRPFGFVPLGGLNDSSYFIGHDYTYEGSKCGRIIEILQECKCMNPVIYFDELDKLSDSNKGNDIENMLCHLTDFTQNNCFHDKYFSGIDFDLSKVLFIFSYNDESKINPILLDRMFKIHTDGFTTDSKIKIAKDYLLPEICKNIGFSIKDIDISKDIYRNIIENYTESEKGVRNLKRCIECIISEVNVLKITNKPKYEDDKEINTVEVSIKNVVDDIVDTIVLDSFQQNTKKRKRVDKFSLPFSVTEIHLNEFLKINSSGKLPMMYM